MILPAMPISISADVGRKSGAGATSSAPRRNRVAKCLAACVAAGLIAGSSIALPAPAMAQVTMSGDDPDLEDIARTPLEMLNLDGDTIPPALFDAVRSPYSTEGLNTCNDIVAQVARIDDVLGADYDIALDEEGEWINEGKIAQKIVGSFIPFRSIVQEVSGANKRRAEVALAVTAGMARRGFLKGLGMARGCDYPARPKVREAAQ